MVNVTSNYYCYEKFQRVYGFGNFFVARIVATRNGHLQSFQNATKIFEKH